LDMRCFSGELRRYDERRDTGSTGAANESPSRRLIA
jgi:hypothetical protein